MPAQILDHPAVSGKSKFPEIDPKTRAIEAYIDASMEAVLRGGTDSSKDGLLFLSSWHEAMPAMVFLDPVLEPVDKVVFAVLWIWGRQQGCASMAFPSYEYLMKRCGISRSTLSRCLAVLRITRWITLCRMVRDARGRNRGNIYALHEEPLALGGTVHLDPEYMGFLNDAARDHHHDRVRRVARAMLDSIRDQMADGAGVLDDSPILQIERRQEAIAYVAATAASQVGSSQSYFGLRGKAINRIDRSLPPRTVAKPVEDDPVRISNSVPCHRVRISNSVGSSSYIYKKTTTTHSDKELVIGDKLSTGSDGAALVYPDSLSQNERALAAMKIAEVSQDLHQPLLDELDGQIRTRKGSSNPIRNHVGFFEWLCNEALAGKVHLTSVGVQVRERREREARIVQRELAKAHAKAAEPASKPRPRGLSEQGRARIREMREACKGG